MSYATERTSKNIESVGDKTGATEIPQTKTSIEKMGSHQHTYINVVTEFQ